MLWLNLRVVLFLSVGAEIERVTEHMRKREGERKKEREGERERKKEREREMTEKKRMRETVGRIEEGRECVRKYTETDIQCKGKERGEQQDRETKRQTYENYS